MCVWTTTYTPKKKTDIAIIKLQQTLIIMLFFFLILDLDLLGFRVKHFWKINKNLIWFWTLFFFANWKVSAMLLCDIFFFWVLKQKDLEFLGQKIAFDTSDGIRSDSLRSHIHCPLPQDQQVASTLSAWNGLFWRRRGRGRDRCQWPDMMCVFCLDILHGLLV